MSVVTLNIDSIGDVLAGIITLSIGMYTYLSQKGYIRKWRTKLSIADDIADATKKSKKDTTLVKLSIPDELIEVLKDMAADNDGQIDAQRIIEILKDRSDMEKILGSNKPLTKEEKEQLHCIMLRAMHSYRDIEKPQDIKEQED